MNRAATFSFDPTRRYWISRGGGGILNKITYIRNKYYFHVYFLFFETLFNSSTCSSLFRKSRKFHSHAVSSVGPGIAKDRKNPLDICVTDGDRENFCSTQNCSAFNITSDLQCAMLPYHRIKCKWFDKSPTDVSHFKTS
jgi:hypothetical protein